MDIAIILQAVASPIAAISLLSALGFSGALAFHRLGIRIPTYP